MIVERGTVSQGRFTQICDSKIGGTEIRLYDEGLVLIQDGRDPAGFPLYRPLNPNEKRLALMWIEALRKQLEAAQI